MYTRKENSCLHYVDVSCSVQSRQMTHVYEVLVRATNYVVVGDSNGVNAAPGGLEDVYALKRTNVPNLRERSTERE